MSNRPPKKRKPKVDTYEVTISVAAGGNESRWDVNIPVDNYNRFWLDLDELIKRYSANSL